MQSFSADAPEPGVRGRGGAAAAAPAVLPEHAPGTTGHHLSLLPQCMYTLMLQAIIYLFIVSCMSSSSDICRFPYMYIKFLYYFYK